MNKLTLNVKKFNFVIFRNINKPYPKEQEKVPINGSEMMQVKATKFWGILVDERLSWSNHIDLVCKRSTRRVGILRKMCPLIHPSAHLTLNYSFFFLPYLNFCNLVWAASYANQLKKLCIIQKRFLRFISHSNRYAPSAPLFIKKNILPIHKLNIYQICLFIQQVYLQKRRSP